MISAKIPQDESERIKILKSFEVLDTVAEKDYDDMVKLASAICQTPISLVSLIDENRQWFKARVGLSAEHTTRDISFCSHAILNDDLFIVSNAANDERFFDNPLVIGDPNIKFYAGMPLKTKSGHKLGTLCVIDTQPHNLSEGQIFALQTLGKQVMNMLELRLKNHHLNRLNSLQNKFLAIISHDVRNPLVTMKSLVEMVDKEEISPDEFKDISGQMGGHVSATIDLLNNLIDWGMAQAGGDKVEIKAIPAGEIIAAEVNRLLPVAHNKALYIKNTVDTGVEMIADENMLKFIIRNLLNNAIKFTAQGGITVSVNDTPIGWQIHVSDTGVGIAETKKAKMFNWEKRFTTHGTDNEAGSGLGLLMCSEFAEKHLGKISFESEENVGTTFTVSINTRFLAK